MKRLKDSSQRVQVKNRLEMEKPPFSTNEGLPSDNHKIPFFSNEKEISQEDYFLTHLALTTKERTSDPAPLRKRRREIESASFALEQIRSSGFPPIFEARDFLALVKVGNQ